MLRAGGFTFRKNWQGLRGLAALARQRVAPSSPLVYEKTPNALPTAVRLAVEQACEPAGLLWEGGALDQAGRRLREDLGSGIQLGLAIKSFPLPAGLSILVPQSEACDVSNLTEYALIAPYCRRNQEIWLTNCPAEDALKIKDLHPNVWWNVVDADELNQAVTAGINVVLRIDSTDAFRSGAQSCVQSRFGWDAASLASLAPRQKSAVAALHLHHPEAKGDKMLTLLLRHALSILAQFPRGQIKRLNLGGGWGKVSAAHWRWARAQVPHEVVLAVEPGRRWTEAAGWAYSTIDRIIPKGNGDTFLTGMLSPTGHLRWAYPNRFTILRQARPGQTVSGNLLWASRSCWDGDRMHLYHGEINAGPGSRIVLGNIAGYAAAWNHGFNGLPAIPARIVRD